MNRVFKLLKSVKPLMEHAKGKLDVLPERATDDGNLSVVLNDGNVHMICYHKVRGTFGICEILNTNELFEIEIVFRVENSKILEQASIKAFLFSLSGMDTTIEEMAATLLVRVSEKLDDKTTDIAIKVKCVASEFNITMAEVYAFQCRGENLVKYFK